MATNGFRLYLRLGDVVTHRDYQQWGEGTVVEEMTSTVPGGTCLARIKFEDGKQRTFNNDLDAQMCCYYLGLRKYWSAEAALGRPQHSDRPIHREPLAIPLGRPRARASRRQT